MSGQRHDGPGAMSGVLLMLAAACAAGGSGQAGHDAGAAPSLEELASATYVGVVDGPVTLSGGRWTGEPYVEGGASRPSVGLVEHFILEGDLDADDRSEAAVLLWQDSGGSGTRSYLAVMGRRNGGLENLGTAFIGDRTQVRSGAIEAGRIILDLVQAAADDPACCPTRLATSTWTLGDDGLDRVATEITGTLSLATLAGTRWRLQELGRQQLVPGDARITLRVDGERISGESGCNRYFATATSETPGRLRLTATGTTRRACPEAMMKLEQQYLAALEHAARYSFLGGWLVIGCDTPEGPVSLAFAPPTAPPGAAR